MLFINLDRRSRVPLARQIYAALRQAALDGTLAPHEKLPSSRSLAKTLEVARGVVVESYAQLVDEGFAESKNGSGTYICEGLGLADTVREKAGRGICTQRTQPKRYAASFRTGIPDLAAIPILEWAKLYRETAASLPAKAFDYQSPQGAPELRQKLAQYLSRVRGVKASAENILITNGAAQAFSLLAQIVPRGSFAAVENPLSRGILHTLEAKGCAMRPVPLDDNGLRTDLLPVEPPTLIFTTPGHQFPTGVIMSAARRVELVRYAREKGAFIAEDDYDCEFRFDGAPIEPMQPLAPERVAHVGTFSKTLMPALRMGYMILPAELTERLAEAKFTDDYHSPQLEQLTLAKFIERGIFDRHIRKMRRLYLKKRDCLVNALKAAFGDNVRISGAAAGLHLAASFPGTVFNPALMRKIEEAGVWAVPAAEHFIGGAAKSPYADMLVLGYGNTAFDEMERGVGILKCVIERPC